MALFSRTPKPVRPQRIRLGFVANLLTRPLVRGIEQLVQRADIEGFAGSEIGEALASDRLDAALVPSLEALRHPEYTVLPTVCVGTFGGGGVAVLCSKVLPTEIQAVCLDGEGQALAPLLEVLLPRQVMIRPSLVEGTPAMNERGFEFESDTGHAYLLSGAAAFDPPRETFCWTWDLMRAWKSYTSLPFVLWVWAVRPGVDLRGLDLELNSLFVGNLSQLDAMALEESKRTGVDKDVFKIFYSKVMHYTFENIFMAGLRRFSKEASDAGLVPGQAPIRAYASR